MSFTAEELNNITNAVLDFYVKGDAVPQSLQDRPLMQALTSKKKTFPGGKDYIRGNVKGDYTTEFVGYTHDDQVGYENPTNIKQFQYQWYEMHAGIAFSYTELKKDGLSIVDSLSGEDTSEHSDREVTAITNLLDDKINDMMEGSARSFNKTLWRDGTQDSKVFPGLRYLIADAPTSGIMGGIDRSVNTWWRNRSLVGTSKIVSSPTSQTLIKTMMDEVLQLRRYSGKPSLWLGGSTAYRKINDELRQNGQYTLTGFTNPNATNIGQADYTIPGIGAFQYDPTLDDLGYADYMYLLDQRNIQLYAMEGEDMTKHTPARPYDRYTFYRAMTYTGCLIANKINSNGVYQVS